MPILVAMLFALFLAGAARLESNRVNASRENMAMSHHVRTTQLAHLVSRYLDERGGVPPTDLAALAATPGYEEARQFLNESGPHGEGPFLYVAALNSSGNTYHRVIVYKPPFDGSITADDYILGSFNKCGTTAANELGPWCGDPQGSWWMTETLSRIPDEISRERLQQQQTLQKFAKVYSSVVVVSSQLKQVFPDPGLGNDSAVTLISRLTGYNNATTAATCFGTWVWQNVPLTCDDLYTVWGTPRIYNYKNEDFISLYAEAPWKEDGLPIVVASQLDSRR
jgi:hypothetical protein